MKSCEYTEVCTEADTELQEYDKKTWKLLLRQTMICLGICCNNFLIGVFLGAPTVIAAQIQSDVNSTETITEEMLSWLTSAMGISSLPFVIILPLLFNRIGRKLTFLFVSLCLFIAYIIFYISNKLYYLLISEILAGINLATLVTISPILIAEYTSPQYRGIFLTLKAASLLWGVWVSNAVGTFYPWKNIAIVSFVSSVYIISIFSWPESPYWLAMRGSYDESAKSHRWLKGVNENSEKELVELINSQKPTHIVPPPLLKDNNKFCSSIKSIWLTITSRPFYKPVLISLTLLSQIHFTGKIVITVYAIEVLKHLTHDQSLVYKDMLILDGVTVFSMYVGCILARYFNRRTLLLLFSSIAIVLLYILALYSYLVSLSVLMMNNVILLLLLIVFSIVVACGPMILPPSIYGEIIPLRYKKLGMISVGLGANMITAVIIKFSPFMFRTLKMSGCFLFFAISSTIILGIIYAYVPETKDKTIREIEEYFNETPKIPESGVKLIPTLPASPIDGSRI